MGGIGRPMEATPQQILCSETSRSNCNCWYPRKLTPFWRCFDGGSFDFLVKIPLEIPLESFFKLMTVLMTGLKERVVHKVEFFPAYISDWYAEHIYTYIYISKVCQNLTKLHKKRASACFYIHQAKKHIFKESWV